MTDHSRQILACARIANDYVASAKENLRALAGDRRAYGRMRPFSTVRMLAAHRTETPSGLEYGVLHAGNVSGRTEPLSLELESLIHGAVKAVENSASTLAQEDAPEGLAAEFCDRMEMIAVASVVLAEAFRHAAALEASEDIRLVVKRRLNMSMAREAADGSEALLDVTIDGHKRRLRTSLLELKEAAPDSRKLADRIRSVRAVPYPVWVSQPDHEGSAVVNDVWLPKAYAEQLTAHRTRESAKANAA